MTKLNVKKHDNSAAHLHSPSLFPTLKPFLLILLHSTHRIMTTKMPLLWASPWKKNAKHHFIRLSSHNQTGFLRGKADIQTRTTHLYISPVVSLKIRTNFAKRQHKNTGENE